jgi:hypothetical protein
MDLKQAVLSQLNKGRMKALTQKVLASRLGLTEKETRQIRLAILDIIYQDEICVCSATQKKVEQPDGSVIRYPAGYYIAEFPEEADEALGVLKFGYGRELYNHYKALRKAKQKAFPLQPHSPEQLSLSLKL